MLTVRGLCARYGRIQALHGVDLEVRQGEAVAIVGANGAGKTTLMRCLSGLQPVAAGTITFCGRDITSLAAYRRPAQGLAHAPEGRQIFTELTVIDNLRLGAFLFRDAQVPHDMERVFALFPVLYEKREQRAGVLSGGQQQMLAIARALMSRPTFLLLDEPSMGLAPVLVDRIFDVIRDLKTTGVTILLVEQNAFGALSLADRGYVMETGHITLEGSASLLLRDPRVREAYLGL